MKLETENPHFVRIEFDSSASAFALQFFTPGLADHTYLVVSGDQAVLIDPQRDYQRFLDVADSLDVKLTAVFETHIHNDYVSGGMLAARERGARYYLPADSGGSMDHTPMQDGDVVALGECSISAMHTPGHTPHHTSYVLGCADGPLAVFSGGSMLIAGVGRTDLLGPELAEPLAHDQFRSVNRIADEMPDSAAVGPTHGAGSFCGSAQTDETVTSVEVERGRNPALLAESEDQFVQELLAGYRLYPDYYAHMAPINVVGASQSMTAPPEASPSQLEAFSHDHLVVDVRNSRDFAAAHIPGSINIPNASSAAVYAGWALPWDQRLVLIAPSKAVVEFALEGFYRIGADRVDAIVSDGLTRWVSEGRTTRSYRVADFVEVEREWPQVLLDARDPGEFGEVRVKGAVNLHFSRILDSPKIVPHGTVWVHCESGLRAAIAASVLASGGREVVLVDDHITHSGQLTATV